MIARTFPHRWATWPPKTQSPYYELFYAAMSEHGVSAVHSLRPTREWLDAGQADAIHVHWPNTLWTQRGKSLVARLLGVRRLGQFLGAAKNAGLLVVWTAHNLRAHEGGDWVDGLGYKTLVSHCDLIVCHTAAAAEELRKSYTLRGEVMVIPHGNFCGVYPQPRQRAEVVAELGLDPARPLVACLGHLRAYKGLEFATQVAALFPPSIQFLIAGHPFKYDTTSLRLAVAALPNAMLIERKLSDAEFADLTAASDVSLLTYRDITTSGVLLASWTLGTGVVATDLPAFKELIPAKDSAAGRLFRMNDAEDCATVVQQYLRLPRSLRTEAALQEAKKFNWPACVLPLAAWIRSRA